MWHIERGSDKHGRVGSINGFLGTGRDPVGYHYWLTDYDSASIQPGLLSHGTEDPLWRRFRSTEL